MIPPFKSIEAPSVSEPRQLVNYEIDRNEVSARIWSDLKKADAKYQLFRVKELIVVYLKENIEWSLFDIEKKLRISRCYTYLISLPLNFNKFKYFTAISHQFEKCLYFGQCMFSEDGSEALALMKMAGSNTYGENLNKLKKAGFPRLKLDIRLLELHLISKTKIEYNPESFVQTVGFIIKHKSSINFPLMEVLQNTKIVMSQNHLDEKEYIIDELRNLGLSDMWITCIFELVECVIQ